MSSRNLRLGCDIGGTFTDFVLINTATGEISSYKTLTTPHDPSQAVIEGLQELLTEADAEAKRDQEVDSLVEHFIQHLDIDDEIRVVAPGAVRFGQLQIVIEDENADAADEARLALAVEARARPAVVGPPLLRLTAPRVEARPAAVPLSVEPVLLEDQESTTQSGIPFLMDIPLLGWLFKKQTTEKRKTNLYFFVTPTILDEDDFSDLAAASFRKKLEARPGNYIAQPTLALSTVPILTKEFLEAGTLAPDPVVQPGDDVVLLGEQEGERITADERKLRQILYNLLSNAVKFTPENGTITLSCRVLRCAGCSARLASISASGAPESISALSSTPAAAAASPASTDASGV